MPKIAIIHLATSYSYGKTANIITDITANINNKAAFFISFVILAKF